MLSQVFPVSCKNITREIILPQKQFLMLCCEFAPKYPVNSRVDTCVEGERQYSLEDPVSVGLAQKAWLWQRTARRYISHGLLVSFRSNFRTNKRRVCSDGITLVIPCGQSYPSLIKRPAIRLKIGSNDLLAATKKLWGGDKNLRSSCRCGNVGLALDRIALFDEAVTDFLCSDGDAVMITESDDLGSR